MERQTWVIAAGACIGLVAGVLAPVVFIAGCVWDGRTKWSALTEPDLFPYWAMLAILGTLNGSVGAWDGWRSGICRLWPVACAPLLLFLFPIAEFARYPSDSKSWGPALLAFGIVAPFVWVAGRVGQEVGRAGRKCKPPQEHDFGPSRSGVI
jgi:hypothetical protein